LALLRDFRTLEDVGRARRYGNQAFQRGAVFAFALLVLLDRSTASATMALGRDGRAFFLLFG